MIFEPRKDALCVKHVPARKIIFGIIGIRCPFGEVMTNSVSYSVLLQANGAFLSSNIKWLGLLAIALGRADLGYFIG